MSVLQRSLRFALRFVLAGLLFTTSGMLLSAQAAAELLVLNETATGTLNSENITDVYIFVATADSTVSLEASSDALSIGMLLTDAQGATLAEAAANEAGVALLSGLTLPQTGSYIVTVFSTSGQGNYEIALLEGTVEATLASDPTETATPTPAPLDETLTPEGAEPEATITEEEAAEPTTEAVTQATTVSQPTSFTPPQDVLVSNGMEVQLNWSAAADINLEVRDPFGNTLFFDSRTSPINGNFGFDANGLCEVISETPQETASWQPGFLPTGNYEILVFYRQDCEGVGSVDFDLNITVNGTTLDPIQGTVPPPVVGQDSVYIASFRLLPDGTATLGPDGFYPDAAIGQLSRSPDEIFELAQPITIGETVTGEIVGEQDLQAFSFEAQAGDLLNITMSQTSGNLDTLLQLVDQNGVVIAFNDDLNVNTRNSQIANQRIVTAGTYVVIATHYGKQFGATEGTFDLQVSASGAQLPAQVANLNLPDGAIEVYLTWNTLHDYQLLVRDPVGASVFDDAPQVTSGGILGADGNVNCVPAEGAPVSYVYWPLGVLRPGVYETEVWFQSECSDTSLAQFTLTIVVNGEVIAVENQNPTFLDRYVISFEVFGDGTAQVGPGGFVGSASQILDLNSETALPVQINQPVTGSINQQNTFDVYTFQGTPGDVVNINMRATSGTLDTNILLLDPNGIEVASNDDADPALVTGTQGRTTDSLINAYVVPVQGTYTIVATRYATIFGGTSGTYTLTVNQ